MLLIISMSLILVALPTHLSAAESIVLTRRDTLSLALNLLPFGGIAFLWFIGAVRDRLGEREDQFFATVFLGSGLLFLAMLFVSAAVSGGILLPSYDEANPQLASAYYMFSRHVSREIMNTYGIRMAGVFMISTCTLFIRTQVIPPWMGWLGYGLAAIMLLRIGYIDRLGWVVLAFPLWVLLISVYILIDNYRQKVSPRAP